MLSLVFWALTFVVTFKYLSFVMRADNRGEGGILALMALVGQKGTTRRTRRALLMLGLFGAALLYGDGVITPAISVLGAVEGLAVAAPGLQHLIVPVTVAILAALFWIQKRGTAAVGAVFGPVMVLWFLCIAALGFKGILLEPGVLRALSPTHAVDFFARNGAAGFLVLGSVVLVITGGEALYADMGHFGKRPIRLAWYAAGPARAAPQLLRAGRAAAPRPGGRAEPVLPAGAVLGPLPHDRHRDRRGHRRVAGAHLGRVLADPAGGAARLLAARDHPAHLAPARSGRSTSPR